MTVIFTIGHSTRTLDELVALLEGHGVRAVVDVRSVPRSRRFPHFDQESLQDTLPARGISYHHLAGLGGRRSPAGPDSPNKGWQTEGLRAYADYAQTPAFAAAVDELLRIAASHGPAAIMCAEAVWWRCHRRLITDALLVRGIEVRHILSAAPAERAVLTPFAEVHDGKVAYPPPQGTLFDDGDA